MPHTIDGIRNDADCIFVTGGAGFIGSAVVRELLAHSKCHVVNIDCLTYAGNLETLVDVTACGRYHFEQVNICDPESILRLFSDYTPMAIIHLAAESHVDRSIDGAGEFIQTNIVGTYTLLQAVREYLEGQSQSRERFRFLHVSTDEVYGSLPTEGLFTEESPYAPNSPYSASKAGSDHLVRAWGETYGLNTLISNCSNNYGPYQYPEKLIPVVIERALAGQSIPVYGSGENVRDWLYVEDHARALVTILFEGQPGRNYNIGGNTEKRNIEVVNTICGILDQLEPKAGSDPREDLITFVEDRPGHDYRYALDSSRVQNELGWSPEETFDSGLRKTIDWYLSPVGQGWVKTVRAGSYGGQRLGLGTEI